MNAYAMAFPDCWSFCRSKSFLILFLVKRLDRLCLQQTHCSNNSMRKWCPVSSVERVIYSEEWKKKPELVTADIATLDSNTQPSDMTNKSHILQLKITGALSFPVKIVIRVWTFLRYLVSKHFGPLALLNPGDFTSFHPASACQYISINQDRSMTVCL